MLIFQVHFLPPLRRRRRRKEGYVRIWDISKSYIHEKILRKGNKNEGDEAVMFITCCCLDVMVKVQCHPFYNMT